MRTLLAALALCVVPPGAATLQIPAGVATLQVPAGAATLQIPAGAATLQVPAGAATLQVPAGAATLQVPAGAAMLQVPGFGDVTLVRDTPRPRHVVVLLADAPGRGGASAQMARILAQGDALVLAIDTRDYLRRLDAAKAGCAYPAGGLEELAELVEKRLDYPAYVTPLLAGTGAGSALAYAGLAESPVGTFAGLVTLAFRPELPTARELCPGRGLAVAPAAAGGGRVPRRLLPATRLREPWVAVQEEADPAFPAGAAAAFVRQVPGARLVAVPRPDGATAAGPRPRGVSGSGAAPGPEGTTGAGAQARPPAGPPVPAWEAPLRAAFAGLADAAERSEREEEAAAQRSLAPAVADLPMLELPAQGKATGTLAVVVSGDGGWNGVDRKVARVLSERGVAVAGLNSKRYFWTPRKPAGAAADLARILRHYLAAWSCRRAVLIGYSQGADVLPFMAGRLPPDLLGRVSLIALLSPGPTTRLEVFTRLRPSPPGADLAVLPELARLAGRPILCLYGDRDRQSICPRLAAPARAVELPGSHGFAGDQDALVDRILAAARGGA